MWRDRKVDLVIGFAFHSQESLPLAAGPVSGGQFALLAVIVMVTTLMLIANARRRREGGPSPRAYAREQIARLKEEKIVHSDITEIMTQLQQVAREINAQLDFKFTRLEHSIRDADDRIDQLERVLRRASGKSTLDVTVSDDASRDPRDSSRADSPYRERIFTLADTGKSSNEIARAVAAPIGEVELVLALRESAEKPSVPTGI